MKKLFLLLVTFFVGLTAQAIDDKGVQFNMLNIMELKELRAEQE